jgi:hypothetical protein
MYFNIAMDKKENGIASKKQKKPPQLPSNWKPEMTEHINKYATAKQRATVFDLPILSPNRK